MCWRNIYIYIPALAYLDDSWLNNFQSTHGAIRAATMARGGGGDQRYDVGMGHVRMIFCPSRQCGLRPTRIQRYLGELLYDSDAGHVSRLPGQKLDKLSQNLLSVALDAGGLSFRTLERVAGKCMSLTIPILPAALWTHARFAVLSEVGEVRRQ